MATSSQYSPSDLVLRLAGGGRDGELITVTTPKCLISAGPGWESVPQCAIFRGPHGAAVRAFGSQVAFNGAIDSMHWLKAGDRIDFANALTMEVTQLGDLIGDCQTSNELATDVDLDTGGEVVDVDAFEDHCLNQIRIQVSKIQAQNNDNSEKFAVLDDKLNLLTDHLNELIFVAKEGHFPLSGSSANTLTDTGVNPLSDFDEEKVFSSLDWESEPEALGVAAAETTRSHEDASVLPEASNNESASEDQAIAESTVAIEQQKIHSNNDNLLTTDGQAVQSFDSLTHSDVEGSDSSVVESTAAPNEFDNSNSLAQQLLNDFAMEERQALSENDLNTEPSLVTEPESQTDIGDIIEKFRSEEIWQPESPVSELEQTVEPLKEAELQILSGIPDSAMSGLADEPEQSPVDPQGHVADLLNRMRIPGQQLFSDFRSADSKNAAKGADLVDEVIAEVDKPPFTEGEFKPAQKAQKIELSAMREIANTNTRRSIQVSEESRRKELGKLRVLVAIFSFFLAVYYFLFVSVGQLNLGFVTGFLCVSITGFLTYKFYETMKFNELLELEKMTVSMNESKEITTNKQADELVEPEE
jgi:hypothetical protein